jgi:uncharacterized membrane protein
VGGGAAVTGAELWELYKTACIVAVSLVALLAVIMLLLALLDTMMTAILKHLGVFEDVMRAVLKMRCSRAAERKGTPSGFQD